MATAWGHLLSLPKLAPLWPQCPPSRTWRHLWPPQRFRVLELTCEGWQQLKGPLQSHVSIQVGRARESGCQWWVGVTVEGLRVLTEGLRVLGLERGLG